MTPPLEEPTGGTDGPGTETQPGEPTPPQGQTPPQGETPPQGGTQPQAQNQGPTAREAWRDLDPGTRNRAATAGAGAGAGAAGAAAVGAFIPGNSVVGAAEGLMNGAVAMAASAGVLPPALVIAFQFKLASGKPQNLEKAANQWARSAEEVRTAVTEWKDFTGGIPHADWNADDREKYQQTVDDYCLQMEYLHNYCMAVHYALISLAWALFVYAIAAITIAAFLLALVTAAAASLGTLYPACVSLAGTALTVTYVMTGILAMAGEMCAGVLAGGAAVTANKQAEHGSREAATAFKQALLTGSAGAGANLLEGAANAGLAWLNRANGEVGDVPGMPGEQWGHRGYGLQSIDLDADRSYDETWNVGGGAKVKIPHDVGPELEISGHRKYGPEGYAGGDFELKGKQPGPGVDLTGGVKREWNAEGEEKRTYSTGIEQQHSGAKVGYEGSVNPDGSAENKATWVAPWGSQQADFDPPWDNEK